MMNFVEQEKGYGNNKEEDQDEDHRKEIIRETSKLPFPFSSSSSSVSSTSKFKPFVPHHYQNSWPLGPFDPQQATFGNKIELIDLSLGNNNNNNNNNQEPSSGNVTSIEKEHMFDKIVTPSDVGKLNRLVIPKQHAERYFPLDSSSNEKGLVLNFEDRNGKAWKFRYSYWNSSQSYVMTKGWSRFVKDKKLDAGDVVSFHRGVGDLGKDILYIDWRRRPDNNFPDPTLLAAQMQLQNQQSVWWGTRLYSFPQSMTISPYFQQRQQRRQQQQQQQQQILGYYLRPSGSQQIERGHMPMVIDSVPVIPGKSTAAKRLRLFGVNMECSTQDDDDQSPATSAPILATSRQAAHEYSKKGKSSLSFDLDL